MLDPIQPYGTKPPLFVVHGVPGYMPLGPTLANALGPDQPVYAVHAAGFDGTEQPKKSIGEMVDAYVGQIRKARPNGPYVIGGMCIGGLIALDIAREFVRCGERVGAVLLLDPVPVPTQWAGLIASEAVGDPKIFRQLQQYLSHFLKEIVRQSPNIPLDLDDTRSVHIATKVAIANVLAAHAHVPVPYSGAAELVICEQRAAGYFHPTSPWRKILERPARVHVLPGGHNDIFGRHRADLVRLVRLCLEGAFEG